MIKRFILSCIVVVSSGSCARMMVPYDGNGASFSTAHTEPQGLALCNFFQERQKEETLALLEGTYDYSVYDLEQLQHEHSVPAPDYQPLEAEFLVEHRPLVALVRDHVCVMRSLERETEKITHLPTHKDLEKGFAVVKQKLGAARESMNRLSHTWYGVDMKLVNALERAYGDSNTVIVRRLMIMSSVQEDKQRFEQLFEKQINFALQMVSMEPAVAIEALQHIHNQIAGLLRQEFSKGALLTCSGTTFSDHEKLFEVHRAVTRCMYNTQELLGNFLRPVELAIFKVYDALLRCDT